MIQNNRTTSGLNVGPALADTPAAAEIDAVAEAKGTRPINLSSPPQLPRPQQVAPYRCASCQKQKNISPLR
jgi:hypothetical protein